MTMLLKKRVFAAKHEATIGTAESLLAADAAMNIFNPKIQANPEVEERDQPGGFGSDNATIASRPGTATFTTFIHGDGSGGVPLWASRLFPACCFVDNGAGVFQIKSASPGNEGVKTLTIGFFEDGVYKQLSGAMGGFKMMFNSGRSVQIDWTFQGKFAQPTDVALITPTYPTNKPIRFANDAPTIGGTAPGCIASMEIDSGSELYLRPCPGDVTAIASAIVTDIKPKGTLDPESRRVTTEDVFGKWFAGSEEALSIVIKNASDTITIAAPRFQRSDVQEADRSGVQVDNIGFMLNGSQSMSISFAATT